MSRSIFTKTIWFLLGIPVPMAFPSEPSFRESLKSESRRYFYERHIRIAIAMILIVFFAPFVGIWVNGLIGAVGGIVLSVAAFYVTPYVVLKLLEG